MEVGNLRGTVSRLDAVLALSAQLEAATGGLGERSQPALREE